MRFKEIAKEQKIERLSPYFGKSYQELFEVLNVPKIRVLAKGIFTTTNKSKLRLFKEFHEVLIQVEALSKVKSPATMDKNFKLTEFINDSFKEGLDGEITGNKLTDLWECTGLAKSTIANKKRNELRKVVSALSESSESPEFIFFLTKLEKHVLNYCAKCKRELNLAYKKQVELNGSAGRQTFIDGSKVIDWCERVINNEIQFKTDRIEKSALSFALACTSGRRFNEIHNQKFYLKKGRLHVDGLSKKEFKKEFEIKCLVSPKKWLEAWERLGDDVKEVSESELASIKKYHGRYLKSIYSDLGMSKYKDSRDFYGAYCVEKLYNSKIHGSQIHFLRDCLGHDSVSVSLSYLKFNVK